MKKSIVFLMSLIFISCGKSKEEQMLYDYQEKGVKKIFKTNLEELDFKINSIEKQEDITAKDSINYFKNELCKIWLGENAKQSEKDTLSYNYVISKLDELVDGYQELIILNAKAGKSYKNYENKKERNKYIDASVNVKSLKSKSDIYSQNAESVLSTKYKVNYSILNPVLKLTQTFDKLYYTDASQTKFIKEEQIN